MSKNIILILLAFVVNIVLAVIIVNMKLGGLNLEATTLGYILGYGIIYWLRPFLFVAAVRLFFNLTNRDFTSNIAISIYIGAWAVLLVGMFYNGFSF